MSDDNEGQNLVEQVQAAIQKLFERVRSLEERLERLEGETLPPVKRESPAAPVSPRPAAPPKPLSPAPAPAEEPTVAEIIEPPAARGVVPEATPASGGLPTQDRLTDTLSAFQNGRKKSK